jgi:hypothetical protein
MDAGVIISGFDTTIINSFASNLWAEGMVVISAGIGVVVAAWGIRALKNSVFG